MKPIDYFQSYYNYFWLWEEEGQVVAINKGSTIIYTEELQDILSTLAYNGLPPLGAVFLALIAINKTEADDLASIRSYFEPFAREERISANDLSRCISFMKLIQSIPREYKVGKRKKILLKTIFDNSHNRIGESTSLGVINYLKEKKFADRYLKIKELKDNIIKKDIQVLNLISYKFTTKEELINAMGNLPDIDEALIPILESYSTSDKTYTDFVDELIDNSQTFHIGALIKPIWAGFNIPIFNAQPSEQPLGGVSDLSNKGNFDKLLISEFANDDMLFMSRIANNEALYLHREMPPVKDKLQRVILIDISLIMWGIPKLIAHAISIAISLHPKAKSNSQLFVVGETYEEVYCDNIGNIIDSIHHVSIAIDASKGIEKFIKENQHNQKLELFYITTFDILKNNETQKILNEYSVLFKYIITTNINGEIDFYQNKNKSLKKISFIQLNLNRLWHNPNEIIQYKEINIENKYIYPILFPLSNKREKLFSSSDSVIYYIYNGAFFRTIKNDKYYSVNHSELIYENLPRNGKFEIGHYNERELLLLAFNHNNNELSIINLHTNVVVKTFFNHWKSSIYKEFIFNDNKFKYIANDNKTFVFCPNFADDTLDVLCEEDSSINLENFYNERQINIKKFEIYSYSLSVLKKVKRLGINDENNLTINQHVFNLAFNNQHFVFNTNSSLKNEYKINASFDKSKQAFVFKDGSEVVINFNGMMILKSSNKSIPYIYIPTVIGYEIGVATEPHFAGSNKFLKTPFYTFDLMTVAKDKLNAVKIIKSHTNYGLSDAKSIIDSVPTKFSLYLDNNNATQLVEKLTEIGCEIKYKKNMKENQEIISVKNFYELYILKFINEILHNESSIKTLP